MNRGLFRSTENLLRDKYVLIICCINLFQCLLVKGWKAGASWSFPRGKKNKDEEDHQCAIREVRFQHLSTCPIKITCTVVWTIGAPCLYQGFVWWCLCNLDTSSLLLSMLLREAFAIWCLCKLDTSSLLLSMLLRESLGNRTKNKCKSKYTIALHMALDITRTFTNCNWKSHMCTYFKCF